MSNAIEVSDQATGSDGREVALRDGSTVTVSAEFAKQYRGIAPTEKTLAILAEALGDDGLSVGNLRRIKVPDGSRNSWTVEVRGEETSVAKLTGIPVALRFRRSYWINEGEPDGSQPDCSAPDNRRPVQGGLYGPGGDLEHKNPTGLCVNCPMAQRNSSTKGPGSACREQVLIFLMLEKSLFPVIVHAPRTSKGKLKSFFMELAEDEVPPNGIIIALGLDKGQNNKKQTYNIIKPSQVRELTDEEHRAVESYAQGLAEIIDQVAQDYSPVEDDEQGEGGIDVGEPDA